MGCEPPRAIQHQAVIGLGSLGAPVTVVGEVRGCQRVRDWIGKEVDVRWHLSKCANDWSEDYPVSAEGAQFRVESALLIPSEPGVEVLGFLVVILVLISRWTFRFPRFRLSCFLLALAVISF